MITPDEAQDISSRLPSKGLVMSYYEFGTGTMEVKDRQGSLVVLNSIYDFNALPDVQG